MKIGAQLFTVRDFCTNLDDFAQTLEKIADIGYKYVQVSGSCEYSPQWLDDQLRKNDLKCTLTHIPTDKIAELPSKVAADHKVFDCPNIGIGYYDIEKCGIAEFKQKFLPAAQTFKKSGCRLFYHNHDIDFKIVDGETIMEQLYRNFLPGELFFTLDTFWVQAAGGDPIWWINHLSGRTPCVHFKDMSFGRKMEPVGYGNMNFEGIFKACVDNKVEYAFVEQDNCNGEDPFNCLKKSFEYLKVNFI